MKISSIDCLDKVELSSSLSLTVNNCSLQFNLFSVVLSFCCVMTKIFLSPEPESNELWILRRTAE